jgi:hypothetical protein
MRKPYTQGFLTGFCFGVTAMTLTLGNMGVSIFLISLTASAVFWDYRQRLNGK